MSNTTSAMQSPEEAQGGRIAARLNWLRAGVMGANDGIVSTAGLVVGVAGAAVMQRSPPSLRRRGRDRRCAVDGRG